MSGFWSWVLVILIVAAVFYAEKLPALRALLEEKFKDSLDAAKEGSKIAKSKIKQVKNEMDKKKSTSTEKTSEENTPEEVEESLKFMGDIIKEKEEKKRKAAEAKKETEKPAEPEKTEKEPTEDGPIDLENRYK